MSDVTILSEIRDRLTAVECITEHRVIVGACHRAYTPAHQVRVQVWLSRVKPER
jgi:hypothetical protein